MRSGIDDLINKEGKWVQVFQGIETIDDPYEKTVTTVMLPPLPVKALVVDHLASKAQWTMPGIVVNNVKELHVSRKHRKLFVNSQKIAIRNSEGVMEEFYGWRVNGSLQIREELDYLMLYIYSK